MKSLMLSTLLLALAVSVSHAQPKASGDMPTREDSQEQAMKKIEAFGWTRSGKGKLGKWSELEVQQGYRFTSSSGTQKMMKMLGNVPRASELGMICPEGFDWFVLFEFEDSGYVKDEDKDKLDGDALLKSLKDGQDEANEERVKQGLHKLFIDGWAVAPKYNEDTHNLEWGLLLHSEEGGKSVNYRAELLGRAGVMHATLLVGPEELKTALPEFQKLIAKHSYITGQSYAEYRQGDKVAEYTLAGLVAAGAGVALLKSGWLAKLALIFAKLGKAAFLVVAGALAVIRKAVARLFGRKNEG